jgi:hypothetical protein
MAYKKWTPEDIDLLKEKYAQSSKEQLLELFPDVNYRRIIDKASELHLLKSPTVVRNTNIIKSEQRCSDDMYNYLTETELAYIAGMVDSDGYISIKGNPPAPGLSITNIHRGVIEWLCDKIVGSSFFIKPRYKNDGSGWCTKFRCAVIQNKAVYLLVSKLKPYLVQKKYEAELVQEYWDNLYDMDARHRLAEKISSFKKIFPSKTDVNLKGQTVMKLSDTESAYLAGLIDGDGSMAINAAKQHFSSAIDITSSSLALLDWFHARNIYPYIKCKKIKPGVIYTIRFHTIDMKISLLNSIIPYLIVKKDQAELLLKYVIEYTSLDRICRATTKNSLSRLKSYGEISHG